MVSIRRKKATDTTYQQYCGGTLIKADMILTGDTPLFSPDISYISEDWMDMAMRF